MHSPPPESPAISQRYCPGAFQWILLEQIYIFQGHMGAGSASEMSDHKYSFPSSHATRGTFLVLIQNVTILAGYHPSREFRHLPMAARVLYREASRGWQSRPLWHLLSDVEWGTRVKEYAKLETGRSTRCGLDPSDKSVSVALTATQKWQGLLAHINSLVRSLV